MALKQVLEVLTTREGLEPSTYGVTMHNVKIAVRISTRYVVCFLRCSNRLSYLANVVDVAMENQGKNPHPLI